MVTDVGRLMRDRRRWRLILLLSMLAMAICIALQATVWRGDAGMPGRLVIGMLFLSTAVACFAWWCHFRLLLQIRCAQAASSSGLE